MPYPTPYDWSRFDVYQFVDGSRHEIFRRWTTADGLASFCFAFAEFVATNGRKRPMDEPLRAGDRYAWVFPNGVTMEGRVLEVELDRLVSFSFDEVRLTIRLAEQEGRTLVAVTQSEMPTGEEHRVRLHLDRRCTWTHVLTVLRGVVESRSDARDRVQSTAGSLGVSYQPPTDWDLALGPLEASHS
jgi:uncharacterized protein YndB with AHSA1/START domain